MMQVLEQVGLEVVLGHHEVAQGQHEIGIVFGDLIEASDNVQKLKYVIKMVLVRVRVAKSRATIIMVSWVKSITFLRFSLSAKTPANGVISSAGICELKPTTPRSAIEPVSR